MMIASIKEATTSQYAQAAPPAPKQTQTTPVERPPSNSGYTDTEEIVEPEELEIPKKTDSLDVNKRQRGRPKKI